MVFVTARVGHSELLVRMESELGFGGLERSSGNRGYVATAQLDFSQICISETKLFPNKHKAIQYKSLQMNIESSATVPMARSNPAAAPSSPES
jgi:hypothetical protein